jgi:hypothetical protein
VPTFQTRIIDAVGDMSKISPVMEALMFSIYCVSIGGLAEAECISIFSAPKKELSVRFREGCQQALTNCEVLRSNDRDSLTALLLYLVGPVARAER